MASLALRSNTRSISLGDCNDDRRLDLVLGTGPNVAVQTVDGGFEVRPGWLSSAEPTQSAVMVDVDKDGLLDVVSAGEGAWVQLHRGMGGCHFENARRIAEPVGGSGDQVMATDVNRDGVIDLTVTRRMTTEQEVYRLLLGRGDGRWESTPAPSTPSPVREEMGYQPFVVHFDDADGDGTIDQWGLVDTQGGWFAWGDSHETLRFTVDETLTRAFVMACPMSISALDFDRDGRVDWFLSGTSRRNMLLQSRGARSLHDVSGSAEIRGSGDAFSWGSFAMDVDLDGWVDVLALQQAPDTPSMQPRDAALWVNQRDESFADWGPELLHTRSTSLGLSCGDLAGDGRIGCLASAGEKLLTLRNEVTPVGRWVGLRLVPTVSAVVTGAMVEVDDSSPRIVQRIDAQVTVYGHHDPGLVLAVGDRERVSVTLTWPSGVVQRLRDIVTNAYTVAREPEVLTVTPRVSPADGRSRVEVSVQGDGQTVTIERDGAGEWQGPAMHASDGKTHRVLIAPRVTGRATISVHVGETVLRVAPVVRFE